jgi:choline transporter-like protein 2/4/5
MWIVCGIALDKGDPALLVLPMDYAGNFCGRNNLPPASRPWMDSPPNGTRKTTELKFDFTAKPFLYFVSPLNRNASKCVAVCPGPGAVADPKCLIPGSAIPSGYSVGGFNVSVNTSGLLPTNNPNCECTYAEDKVMPQVCFVRYESTPIMRRCIPSNKALISPEMKAEAAKVDDLVTRAMDDVQRGWKAVAISGAIALLLGFVWLVILRWLAGVMVWVTILACLAGCAALSFYTFNEGNTRVAAALALDPQDPDKTRNAKGIQILSYCFFGVTGILILITLFMFKRIQIAIEIIKLAGKALNAMPFLITVPIFGMMAVSLVFIYFGFIGVYLYSAGTVEYDGFSRTFVFDKELKKVIAYHVFGCIWTVMFIIGVCQVTIAGAVAQFYFTREPDEPLPLNSTGASFWRCIRYHLGSVAFGSFIIAVVVMIRLTLEYIKRQLKKDNKVLKSIICIIECCMACFQRFIEFLTTNAYIQIAIAGHSFCTAAKDGWSLIVRNVLRVAAVSVVSTFVIFLGTLAIVVASMFACNEILKKQNPPIESFLLLLMAFLLSYAIAMLFMGVYEMAIKTTLQCFCMDEEQNAPDVYAPPSLREYMDGVTIKAAKKLEKDQK